ncbi:MAG: hypothetical protein HRT68_16720 [Flavobacteriaceae bacterium]|nr:hypothetical protein [Flavobacteriaceae bacterium]
MSIKHIKSLSLPGRTLLKMTPEVRKKYQIFLDNHLKYIHDFCSTGYENRSDIHNNLLFFVEDKIVAFRYFVYQGSTCELFNTYVDSCHRKQSIATSLIEHSVSLSNDHGVSNFVVRMASENEERTGLFNKYKNLVKDRLFGNQFTIYYAGKMVVFE